MVDANITQTYGYKILT